MEYVFSFRSKSEMGLEKQKATFNLEAMASDLLAMAYPTGECNGLGCSCVRHRVTLVLLLLWLLRLTDSIVAGSKQPRTISERVGRVGVHILPSCRRNRKEGFLRQKVHRRGERGGEKTPPSFDESHAENGTKQEISKNTWDALV